ncbi:TIGR00282 family metallophosphoesterase [Candidatus Paracaedibacter symbiosus]|uniref:TIGR00282 family metallophosphoesterase n=1 Tax=Candidatus Paracaedibacter symbiosus TaxID=244582 RepID=UPI000509A593|nr:TIGR00282 family metallophosphoesterase [Candidatus Paracaedibacter symbiosus]
MRILYCGDIVGRSGREAVLTYLPKLKAELSLDFIIANGENSAHGFGITKTICQELFTAGVDVITSGNHIWDQREIMSYINQEKRLLRPINYPATAPGKGFVIATSKSGKQVLVINAMARLFMDPLDDPFSAVDNVLKQYPLKTAVTATVLDFHGEASSEKMTMGHFCDGRASLVVGSHSHVPTGDAQILPGGTAYQTDAGMCGDYNSVIGMEKSAPLHRFTKKTPGERLTPATGPGTFCGTFVEVSEAGLAIQVSAVIRGPRLRNVLPE